VVDHEISRLTSSAASLAATPGIPSIPLLKPEVAELG